MGVYLVSAGFTAELGYEKYMFPVESNERLNVLL
jgi:hypothetical protein